ncbi:hypothetical protein EDD18DRAFT_1114619 [Armillaria luteobubalina]|uniref:Uncharacterized protein n=1 Tax=Armillaria luteobubalina TaxID=153913 RepID=A0AA39P6A9_9AGAR|nr:hypothetical protein EDD18DRAFT_1114619 [Armillaria luteobubalina]
MKLHRVGIHGLEEEMEIRLEGQEEVWNILYLEELSVINEYVKLKLGNRIHRIPIMSWGWLDELKVDVHGVHGMLMTMPEAYVVLPTPEDADPDALEVLYAEQDERDAAYCVAVEAHDEWRIVKEAAAEKAKKEAAATEETCKKEEQARKIAGAKVKKEAMEKQ